MKICSMNGQDAASLPKQGADLSIRRSEAQRGERYILGPFLNYAMCYQRYAMRNDANDELDHIPSLTATREKPYPTPELEPLPRFSDDRPVERGRPKSRARTAPLWITIVLLSGALLGLGWWAKGHVERLEAQLVATQESFARISEDAAGRLQDISGKIVATESSVTTEGEALKLRIKQLEQQVIELNEQLRAVTTQQQSLAGRQSNHEQRLEEQAGRMQALATEGRNQQAAAATLTQGLEQLGREQTRLKGEQDALKSSQEALAKLPSRFEAIDRDIAALKRQGDAGQAISRLEQELLVLRSELDNRPAAAPGVNTTEFDAFRAQVTRNINTLQSQIANLQEQISRR